MKKTMKRKSKRIPTKQRVKAEKKVREHNRKLRKEKKLKGGGVSKKSAARKGLTVPNDCPFKEAVLEEVEAARKRKQQEKEDRRRKFKEGVAAAAGERMAKEGGIQNMMSKAAGQNDDMEVKGQDVAIAVSKSNENSAKVHYKEFSKVVEAADVILEVLDARDPMGTRSLEVEKSVLDAGKRVVVVINKADLVPKDNLTAWIKHLQSSFPVVAFKSSTQQQVSKLGQLSLTVAKASDAQMQTSKAVGAATLMSLLGNYCRNKDIKTSIRVGVVGYPNVGKSSLINSLKRGKVCTTGNLPGVTKKVQEVQLDSKIKLLDSPGMVLGAQKENDAQVALRNTVKLDQLNDLLLPVEAILQRCETRYLQTLYNLSQYNSVQEFLGLLAKATGKLKKGGVPDLDAAARMLVSDWNGGKIKYYTHPPQIDVSEEEESESAKVLSTFSEEFSLDSLEEMMETDKEQLPDVPLSATTKLKKEGDVAARVSVVPSKDKKEAANDMTVKVRSQGMSLKRSQKASLKKDRKKRNRQERLGQQLSDMMKSSM